MDNRLVSTTDRKLFLEQLNTIIDSRLEQSEAVQVKDFAAQYYAFFPIEELQRRAWSDVYGAIYAWWNYIDCLNPKTPMVRVFNPNLEEHGWLCPHTVVVIAMRNMPFLVDSIRMEINRHNISIHTVVSSVINITRDDKNQIVNTQKANTRQPKKSSGHCGDEAMIYFEINLHTSLSEMAELASSITKVLDSVALVVDDYSAVLEKTDQTIENMQWAPAVIDKKNLEESKEFIQWLKKNFFTFLGYSEYEIYNQDGESYIREIVSERLGICKENKANEVATFSDDYNSGMARFHLTPYALTFSKSGVRSRVHRPSYGDYIVVKIFNEKGVVCGERRFLGLFTSKVYVLSPENIPLIRKKIEKIKNQSGLDPHSFDGKVLSQVIETFPRDELFQSTTEELYQTTSSIARINERHMVRLYMREDLYGKYVSCLVYMPRDIFSTHIREKIQQLISKALNALECEYNTFISESVLARAYLVFRLDPKKTVKFDVAKLEREIVDITRTWDDNLLLALNENNGEEKGSELYKTFSNAFTTAYKENFEARIAVHDIDVVKKMEPGGELAMVIYQPIGSNNNQLRFKAFNYNAVLELSDIIPVLENLGLRVVGEHPYRINLVNGNHIWMHDFTLRFGLPVDIDVQAAKKHFQEAFSAIWYGLADSDPFNRLVLGARLNWREITILRAYANYMKQTLFNFGQEYIASTLANHLYISRHLIALFKARFDPRVNKKSDADNTRIERLNSKIIEALDKVDNLNEDRIIRRYLDMINATVRTNFFQTNKDGSFKEYLSLKMSPRKMVDIPEPRPLYEIYVYSPKVEGVHLRGSKVARGGLRWSDRFEDYRTEVLGLVKAQQVKNAVIVPSGAKGGFIAKRPPLDGDRKAILDNGIACYKIFIKGLLDITDNLVNGAVVPPEQVVRMDDDDPYLVVAADKGTATFSDIANSISEQYGHWLGDAFASGGSQGYDHKGMGITARGAWVSVQRHFKEKHINVQAEDFTVIGIGDMAGDVFGNGMLLSRHIELVAAFNHMHIFIDPNPDTEKSFIERERLFQTPGLTWQDYNAQLISAGGGVFNRNLKSIAISPEMKQRFDITAEKLTPTELINALLKAPVDMIWNGGIGTYVKSSKETHVEAGDKSNDALRVNGKQLRCKVFGEGGNLGMTQLGRVEYCMNGGSCNTDFIDNAAGVDCSDHEVNIKILLNEVVQNGDMTVKQRNALLQKMTHSVADLVLENNYRQTQAISLAESQIQTRTGEYRRFISELETQGLLNRELEFLPSDDEILERQTQGSVLTRPELSVLLSYAKVELKESFSKSSITEDEQLMRLVESAFPVEIRETFHKEIYQHRLRKEIVATQLANDIVNIMGVTFCHRLMASTGSSPVDVAKSYAAVREIYHIEEWWQSVEMLDFSVKHELQMALMALMAKRIRRATRWFLRNRRGVLNPSKEIAEFETFLQKVIDVLPDILKGQQRETYEKGYQSFIEQGLPPHMAKRAAIPSNYSYLNMVEASKQSGECVERVAEAYFHLGQKLELHWFGGLISDVKVENYWQAMAREAFTDDLESQTRIIVISILGVSKADKNIEETITLWMQQHKILVQRWMSMINELKSALKIDFSMFSVALRELLDLAQSSRHCQSLDDDSAACVLVTTESE